MPVTLLDSGKFEDEIIIDGDTVAVQVPFSVIEVIPNSGSDASIFLELKDGSERWKWNAPVNDWNVYIDSNPDAEPRWQTQPV